MVDAMISEKEGYERMMIELETWRLYRWWDGGIWEGRKFIKGCCRRI